MDSPLLVMIPGFKLQRFFLLLLGFIGVFLLLFMLLSTQYLTITTTIYRDMRTLIIPRTSSQNESQPTKLIQMNYNINIIINETTKVATTFQPHLVDTSTILSRNSWSPSNNSRTNDSPVSNAHKEQTFTGKYKDCFNFTINKPNVCTDNNSSQVAIVVISSVIKNSARNAIRETWGGLATKLGIPVVFLLGGTTFSTIEKSVENEDSLYKDIVQEDCIDTYRNMTLKTISMMKWVAEYCSNIPHILKVDDDMIINVELLLRFVNTAYSNMTIYGRLAKNWRPHRSRGNKWYVAHNEFDGSVFPDFTTGPAYLFTSDAANSLYTASLKVPFLFLEDVFMTGIVAEKVGVQRVADKHFQNFPQRTATRNFRRLISSHGHSPKNIYQVWFKYNRPSLKDKTLNQYL